MNPIDYIDKASEILERLNTASAITLTFFFCMVMGLVLQSLKRVDNRSIPRRMIYTGAIVMVGLTANSWPNSVAFTIFGYILRQGIIGGIVGSVAWVAYRWGLKLAFKAFMQWFAKKYPGIQLAIDANGDIEHITKTDVQQTTIEKTTDKS